MSRQGNRWTRAGDAHYPEAATARQTGGVGTRVYVRFKVFADRPRDWLDVVGIVVKSDRLIDWDEVRRDLTELLELKGDATALARLEKSSRGYRE